MSTETKLRAIHQLVDALPPDGYWTADKRRRWLEAMAAAADWAVEVRDA